MAKTSGVNPPAGGWIVGAAVSRTVTVKVAVPGFPRLSLALTFATCGGVPRDLTPFFSPNFRFRV